MNSCGDAVDEEAASLLGFTGTRKTVAGGTSQSPRNDTNWWLQWWGKPMSEPQSPEGQGLWRQVQLWMEMPNVKFLANVKKSSEKSFTTIISTKVIMSQFWNGNHDLKNAIFLHISATLNQCFSSYTCFGEDFALTFLAICRNPGAEWSVTKWRKHEGHIRNDHYWPTCIGNTNKEIWRNTNAQI